MKYQFSMNVDSTKKKWGKLVLFSDSSVHWATPVDLYERLNEEFNFNLDPCPLKRKGTGLDGLKISWKNKRVFCNPPYGAARIPFWLRKAKEAQLAVFLLPARTDTNWWHEFTGQCAEIRFLKGRLRFNNSLNSAPFPSVVLVFRK